ncbi:hypothetical protein MEPL11_3c01440 [Melissococcus plutonius]|nr:hypothetical protein MEPL9_3c01440 [Melissococcus plutonius]KMT36225.1 hypothetical protein MEPL10_5c01440 [Melissococcus plutonius]KMT38874.1 hypothetical protein MEPL11_3c01440 [Melissococcus plutonius]
MKTIHYVFASMKHKKRLTISLLLLCLFFFSYLQISHYQSILKKIFYYNFHSCQIILNL